MMLNDTQLAAVCRAVCRAVCQRIQMNVELWTLDGPTELARRWKKRSPLSGGERVLLLVAWSLWNNSTPRVLFSDLSKLDGDNLVFIGSLLVAIGQGHEAVGRWLDAQEGRNG